MLWEKRIWLCGPMRGDSLKAMEIRFFQIFSNVSDLLSQRVIRKIPLKTIWVCGKIFLRLRGFSTAYRNILSWMILWIMPLRLPATALPVICIPILACSPMNSRYSLWKNLRKATGRRRRYFWTGRMEGFSMIP